MMKHIRLKTIMIFCLILIGLAYPDFTSARMIRNFRIIAEHELIEFLKPIASKIKVIVSDLDGTLIDDIYSKQLKLNIANEIGHITSMLKFAIATSGKLERQKNRIADSFPENFDNWNNLSLFPYEGAAGYRFEDERDLKDYYENAMSEEMEINIIKAISDFEKEFGEIIKPNRKTGENRNVKGHDDKIFSISIDLKESPNRTEEEFSRYIDYFKNHPELQQFIEKNKLYVLPGRDMKAIHFRTGTKADVIDYIIKEWDISPEEILVIGDSAGDWLMYRPEITVINVGPNRNILPEIWSFKVKRSAGALLIIKAIKQLRQE